MSEPTDKDKKDELKKAGSLADLLAAIRREANNNNKGEKQ